MVIRCDGCDVEGTVILAVGGGGWRIRKCSIKILCELERLYIYRKENEVRNANQCLFAGYEES